MSRNPLRKLALLALAIGLVSPVAAGRADDTVLFSAAVSPNVLIIQDNSGSMNNAVWYTAQTATTAGWLGFAGYNPLTAYPCSSGDFASGGETALTADTIYSVCGKSNRKVYVDAAVSPANATIYDNNYLRYLFTLSSTNYTTLVSKDGTNGTCATGLGAVATYKFYRRTRVTASKDILRNVICDANAAGEVRFGLAQFRRGGGDDDPNGGYVLVPVNDWKYDNDGNPATPKVAYSYSLNGLTKTHQQHMMDAINSIDGETWTPLGEALFQNYTYFMSRTTADVPLGRDALTKFPKYSYVTAEANNGGRRNPPDTGAVPGSPVQYACQKSFIIMITDGEPTKDDFDDSNTGDATNQGFSTFGNVIGDYNPDNATAPENGAGEVQGDEYCSGCESANYLDDIAKYMHEKDFRPDMNGSQVIDVYTVGFTTGDAANALLQKAASAGGGKFYASSDPTQLADDIVDALTDIIQKSQAFTAATVPASRTTDGNNFYTSFFLPLNASFWEGHLKNFEFTASGRINDSLGSCALADPGAPTTCETGALITTAPAYWDAATAIPVPASRNLYVGTNPAPASGNFPTAFTAANLAAADLTVTYPPAIAYPGSVATNAEQLADEIVNYARGCVYGTACTTRFPRLADIFHSNPIVIGPPNSALNDPTYVTFASTYGTRKKVIYAGSNGGFVHGFDAGTWRTTATAQVPTPPAYDRGTGAEVMGFMPYSLRKTIKNLPIDTPPRDYYYVDGPPQAADGWFYPTATTASKVWSDWHTVLVGGLRQGGRTYYALDVTNSSQIGSAPTNPRYPAYLWEFPCEAATCDSLRPYMGETWSEPVITRVKVAVSGNDNAGQGFERWVAIVGAGYDPKGDPNDILNYDTTSVAATSRAGRAILMIDLKTGAVLGMRKFDNNPALGETAMKYAFASTPAVFDLNRDGFADVVYIGDLGGQLWKWVISPIGVDPVNGSGSVAQPSWPLKRFLTVPSFTDVAPNPIRTYYKSIFYPPTGTNVAGSLWLAFGTGERNNLKFAGLTYTPLENNRFYVVKDLDPQEKESPVRATLFGADPTTAPTNVEVAPVGQLKDLRDLTNVAGCNPLSSPYGYFIRGTTEGEKFVTNPVIFINNVFEGSFVPSTSTDPCASGGEAFLYAFKLTCSEGFFPTGSTPPEKRKVKVGPGLPNRPRSSVGPTGGAGGGGGGCANQLLVVTSDGTAWNKSAGCLQSKPFTIDTWRELQ